jgi:ADP-ribose pyrophosphatase YjhB (NUDIX family)
MVTAMSNLPKHSVSVAGVVINNAGRVLTIRRRDNGHWEAPGGVLELDESPEAGVYREVAEETGMRVRVERLTGVYKNITRGIVALVFRCSPESGELHPTDEAREVRWMSREEVCNLMDPAFAVRVLDAFGDEPIVRTHDGINVLAQPGR